jgi:hypothetical protein
VPVYRTVISNKNGLARIRGEEVGFTYEDDEWRVTPPFGFPRFKREDAKNYYLPYNGISLSTNRTRRGQLREVDCVSEADGLRQATERLQQRRHGQATRPPLFNLYQADVKQLLREGGPLHDDEVCAILVEDPTVLDPGHVLLLLDAGKAGNNVPARQLVEFIYGWQADVSPEYLPVDAASLRAVRKSLSDWQWTGLVEPAGNPDEEASHREEKPSTQSDQNGAQELGELATILQSTLRLAERTGGSEFMLQLYGYLALLRDAPSLQDFYRCLDGRDRMVLRLILNSYHDRLYSAGIFPLKEVVTCRRAMRSLDSFESEYLCEMFERCKCLQCAGSLGFTAPKFEQPLLAEVEGDYILTNEGL